MNIEIIERPNGLYTVQCTSPEVDYNVVTCLTRDEVITQIASLMLCDKPFFNPTSTPEKKATNIGGLCSCCLAPIDCYQHAGNCSHHPSKKKIAAPDINILTPGQLWTSSARKDHIFIRRVYEGVVYSHHMVSGLESCEAKKFILDNYVLTS